MHWMDKNSCGKKRAFRASWCDTSGQPPTRMTIPDVESALKNARRKSAKTAAAHKQAKASARAAKSVVRTKKEAVKVAKRELKLARRAAKAAKRVVSEARAAADEAEKLTRTMEKESKTAEPAQPAPRARRKRSSAKAIASRGEQLKPQPARIVEEVTPAALVAMVE